MEVNFRVPNTLATMETREVVFVVVTYLDLSLND